VRQAGTIASGVMVIAAGVIQFSTSVADPRARWSIAAVVLVLCVCALVMPLAKRRGVATNGRAMIFVLYAAIVAASFVVLGDLAYYLWSHSRPVDCVACEIHHGISRFDAMPLYLGRHQYFADVADIKQYAADDSLGRYFVAGSLYSETTTFIDLKLVKRPHVRRAVIDNVELEVVRFVPLGTIWEPQGAAPAGQPSLTFDNEIPFVVLPLYDQRPKPLPWKFEATHSVTNGERVVVRPWWQYDRQLAAEKDYARYHLFILGTSPGWYEFDIYAVVNNVRIRANRERLTYFVYEIVGPPESDRLRNRLMSRRRPEAP
jgi:hypothetical protein